jgi:hypothetical protein
LNKPPNFATLLTKSNKKCNTTYIKARDSEKPHFSGKVLDAAERAQRTLDAIGAPVVNMVAGSSSPAYRQLRWAKQAHLNPHDFEWCEVPGDPSAGLLPRFWKNAVVLGVNPDTMRSARAANSNRGERVDQAIVYEHNGIRVGVSSDDDDMIFGHQIIWDTPSRPGYLPSHDAATVAVRLGRGPLRVTMGLWFPDQKNLVVPSGVEIVEAGIPIDSLTDKYSHTALF